ncbi:MAG TPA: transglutaminase-like cysteine peptidase [Pararhizobium sp.]|jgi:predicted transglutaminase-like cysteine proteinase|nr:transglutaminase-like cysteine peptidase [Pararhizobium sp.]
MGPVWKLAALAVAAFAYAIPSTLADAAPGPLAGVVMITGGATSQPIGHYGFCKRFQEECQAHKADQHAPKLTEHGWDLVREVNSTVNRTIVPETDQDLYGKEEFWTYPQKAGDCEDYALLKQYMLEQRGFKPSDLLITVVRKPDGEGHAVLTVRTEQGDYVLDNLDDQVKPWTQTPYTYLKRQAENNSGRWVSIENGNEMLVGAVR